MNRRKVTKASAVFSFQNEEKVLQKVFVEEPSRYLYRNGDKWTVGKITARKRIRDRMDYARKKGWLSRSGGRNKVVLVKEIIGWAATTWPHMFTDYYGPRDVLVSVFTKPLVGSTEKVDAFPLPDDIKAAYLSARKEVQSLNIRLKARLDSQIYGSDGGKKKRAEINNKGRSINFRLYIKVPKQLFGTHYVHCHTKATTDNRRHRTIPKHNLQKGQ